MSVNLITVSGPRGAGKDTVISNVLETFGPQLHRIIPCTTRSPREGEEHGKQQYFISEQEFAAFENAGKFIFTNPLNGNGYRSGTLKTELEYNLSIVDITAAGAEVLRNYAYSHGGRVISLFLFADYHIRFSRVKLRQVSSLTGAQVEDMLKYDPTIPDLNQHPDWFIKIENPENKLDGTLQRVYLEINSFLRNC
jgi:guanylate kinase